MFSVKRVGSIVLAVVVVTAMTVDAADARRGGGGMRGGGGGMRGGGGGMRTANIGGGNIGGRRPSHPIAGRPGRPSHPIAGLPGRPGGPVGPGRPGIPPGGGGYWPGYGWGVAAGAAVGAGWGYSNWCDPTYGSYCNNYAYAEPAPSSDDAIAACAQRFRTYDVATQTYVGKGGKRKRCP